MGTPFFSIIVVSFQAKDTIQKTIDSILAQTFTDFEVIVKDACSKDGTTSLVPKDERFRLFITPDRGIYDGMNEAVGYARGKYLHFLNCGDVFSNGQVLSSLYEQLKDKTADPALVYGNFTRKGVFYKQPSAISEFFLYKTVLCHQSILYSKSFFANIGAFDTTFKICADHDVTVRAFTAGASFIYCPITVCDYQGDGVSESAEQRDRRKQEIETIREKYFSPKKRRSFERKIFFSFKGLRQKLVSDKAPRWIRNLYRKLVNRING